LLGSFEGGSSASSAAEKRRVALMWIALAAALSPALADWAAHVVLRPWARASIVFPLLLAWSIRRDRSRARPALDGYLWIALGLAFSVVGVGGGMPRVARPGIALCVIGLARATGYPSLPVAMLAAFAMPLPSVLFGASGTGLEALVGRAMTSIAGLLGMPAELDARTLNSLRFVTPGGVLELVPGDGALSLAWALAGVGWFGAALRGAALRDAALASARWSVLALPIQTCGLALAGAATLAGAAGPARLGLDFWPLLAVCVGVWHVARSAAAAAPAGRSPA